MNETSVYTKYTEDFGDIEDNTEVGLGAKSQMPQFTPQNARFGLCSR